MGTIREILEAHRSGISRPGLLAWARLRIDIQLTEAQLEEELARLGDEVVDVDGFLYLRRNLDAARRLRRTDVPPVPGPLAPSARRGGAPTPPSGVQAPRPARAVPSILRPPAAGRRIFGWLGKAIGGLVLAWWIAGFVGGFLGAIADSDPSPTSPVTLPSGLTGIAWTDLAVGDCFATPNTDDYYPLYRLPCDEPHQFEVYDVTQHPGADYPGDEGFESYGLARCIPAFAAYTGSAYEDQDLLVWFWWAPLSDAWGAGERTVQCLLALADATLATQSYRGATP
jgi:hypothetical protein